MMRSLTNLGTGTEERSKDLAPNRNGEGWAETAKITEMWTQILTFQRCRHRLSHLCGVRHCEHWIDQGRDRRTKWGDGRPWNCTAHWISNWLIDNPSRGDFLRWVVLPKKMFCNILMAVPKPQKTMSWWKINRLGRIASYIGKLGDNNKITVLYYRLS